VGTPERCPRHKRRIEILPSGVAKIDALDRGVSVGLFGIAAAYLSLEWMVRPYAQVELPSLQRDRRQRGGEVG
jgi:hypothetical protein